jgi:hypothetical protein
MNVISIYISHLIPFFHVCQLEGINNVDRKDVIINTVYSPEVNALVNLIKTELTNELIYYEFPNHILLKKVPKIKSEEHFTYLNAFFIDNYRINNF